MSIFNKLFNTQNEIPVKEVFKFEYALEEYGESLFALYQTLTGRKFDPVNNPNYTDDDYRRDVFHIVSTAEVNIVGERVRLFEDMQDLVSEYQYYFNRLTVALDVGIVAILANRVSKLSLKSYQVSVGFNHLRVADGETTVLYGRFDIDLSDFSKKHSKGNRRLVQQDAPAANRPNYRQPVASSVGQNSRPDNDLSFSGLLVARSNRVIHQSFHPTVSGQEDFA